MELPVDTVEPGQGRQAADHLAVADDRHVDGAVRTVGVEGEAPHTQRVVHGVLHDRTQVAVEPVRVGRVRDLRDEDGA